LSVPSIPKDYHVDLDVVSSVQLGGLPTAYRIDINSLPKIQIAVDPITINPVDVSVRLKEVPSVRAHIPAVFTVGFSILGLQLASIRLCGEAQVINEPYIPNPCEQCDGSMLAMNVPPPAPEVGVVVPVRGRRKGK